MAVNCLVRKLHSEPRFCAAIFLELIEYRVSIYFPLLSSPFRISAVLKT